MSIVLSIENVSKSFPSGSKLLKVLQNINFQVNSGDSVSIVGPSGSGKTTLLGLCAGLDIPTDGNVKLYGNSLPNLSEDEKAELRNQYVGFIFQNFQLIPTLTALENVMIPLELKGNKEARSKASKYLERVGLAERGHHYPSQLSGGEQQRVSLARAFANEPKILFADEPTGNLDGKTGQNVEDLLFSMNQEFNTTLILVTHDMELAGKTDRIIKLKNGLLVSDEIQNKVIS